MKFNYCTLSHAEQTNSLLAMIGRAQALAKKLNTQSSLRHGKISLFIKQEENFGISRFSNVLKSEKQIYTD